MSDKPKSKRRRWLRLQFKLPTLLAAMVLAAVGWSCYPLYVKPYQKQQAAAKLLEEKEVKLIWRRALSKPLHKVADWFGQADLFWDVVEVHAQHRWLEDEHFAAIADLPNVERLYLARTPITNDGLKHLAELREVRRLSLWGTKITDDGLAHLGNWTKLEALDINQADFYEVTRRFGTATGATVVPMRRLYAQERQPLSVRGLRHLRAAQNLEELGFSFPVNNAGLHILAQFPKLRMDSLYVIDVTDDGLAHLSQWPDLKNVAIERGVFGWQGTRPLRELPKLKWLTLKGIHAHPKAWEQLGELKSLEALELEDTSVDDKSIQRIGRLVQLKHLSLRDANINDEGLDRLRKLVNLEYLDLIGTRVKYAYTLAKMTKLKRLNFRIPLDDHGLRNLAQLKSLEGCWGLDHRGDLAWGVEWKMRLSDWSLKLLADIDWVDHLELEDNGLSDEGLRQLLEQKSYRSLDLHSPNITTAGIGYKQRRKGLQSGWLNLHTPRTVADVMTAPLKLSPCNVIVKRNEVTAISGAGLLPSAVSITFTKHDCDLSVLSKIPDIRKLEVRSLGDSLPLEENWKNLRFAPKLERFTASKVTAETISQLGNIRTLKSVELELKEPLAAAEFAPLGQLVNVEYLSIRGQSFGEEELESIGRMKSLRELRTILGSVRDNHGLRHLANLKSLERLMLDGVNNEGLVHIGQIKSLESLTVSGRFDGKGTRPLEEMPNLRSVYFPGSAINERRLKELRAFVKSVRGG